MNSSQYPSDYPSRIPCHSRRPTDPYDTLHKENTEQRSLPVSHNSKSTNSISPFTRELPRVSLRDLLTPGIEECQLPPFLPSLNGQKDYHNIGSSIPSFSNETNTSNKKNSGSHSSSSTMAISNLLDSGNLCQNNIHTPNGVISVASLLTPTSSSSIVMDELFTKPLKLETTSNPLVEATTKTLPTDSTRTHTHTHKRKFSPTFENFVDQSQTRCDTIKRLITSKIASGFISREENILKRKQNIVKNMTTITCFHASVAQKSYGSEKRFLCPPPVTTITGAESSISEDRAQISMSVMCETGSEPIEQKSVFDENNVGCFKFLHVSGTAKAKQFTLKLKIINKNNIPFATFDSVPISIISKPSKKTSKTRNVSSCILSGSTVSLFNRINSQTARTKCMGISSGMLCGKTSDWTAFTITQLNPKFRRKGGVAQSNGLATPSSINTPITYGSQIILTDPATGFTSDPLFVRKVEKGRVTTDASGPVSQMQKVALQKSDDDESGVLMYLSASGPADPQDSNENPFLTYKRAKVVTQPSGSRNSDVTVYEEVEDNLCWTIVGICKFEYTYFETLGPATRPITPFPSLSSAPIYKPHTNTLELTVRHFQAHDQPLEVWLGNHGPLDVRIIWPSVGSVVMKGHETVFVAHLPRLDEVFSAVTASEKKAKIAIALPLLFVRNDGIVYNVGQCLIYEETPGRPRTIRIV